LVSIDLILRVEASRDGARLAAIFAADVEGYSRLMGEDEVGTLQALSAHRAILDRLIAEHRGRIANTAGDSVLAEFPSAVDAVQCSLLVQDALAAANGGLSEERRVQFRIGIHVGDVMIKGGDLFGDGVNIAARLQTLATAGGVCLSGVAYDQVRKILPVAFADLGAQQVKNIDEPVRAFALVATAVVTASENALVPLALPDKPSIAVLPFLNMSDDPEQDYFADGIVEEIITGLSRIKWLFVIGRNSSFSFRRQAVDVNRIGRRLGVRYVLEGRVRRAGERVRISAQLLEAETGIHIWAERYDRPFDDIFALQDELTLSVVGAIVPSLQDAEIDRVKRKRPDNLDAYDLVLRAIPRVYVAAPEQAAKAVPLLEQALALEVDYASAHGLLAWCHLILFVRSGFGEDDRIAALRHARAAITHGRDDATALAMGAFAIGLVEHDRIAAGEAFEQALALSPSSALTLFLGSVVLAYAGEAERAIEWAERASRFSPIDRLAFAGHQALALAHFLRGQYEEAANAARRAVLSNSSFSVSYSLLAAALVKLGRTDEAQAAARQALVIDQSFSSGGYCKAVGVMPKLAKALIEAWREAGLPP
jgi:adenylate cyclase